MTIFKKIKLSVWEKYFGTGIITVYPKSKNLEELNGVVIKTPDEILCFHNATIKQPKSKSMPPVRPPKTGGIIKKGIF